MSAERFEALYGSMAAAGVDTLALNPGPSLAHMTGLEFHLMERPVILLLAPGREAAIVLPLLEESRLGSAAFPVRAFPYGEDPARWAEAFKAALGFMGIGKGQTSIGVEGRSLRFFEYRFLEAAAPSARFVDATDLVGRLRARKDASEILSLRKAVALAQDALEDALPFIRIGMTEKELAAEIVMRLLMKGSEPGRTGSPIVASGARAADPHAGPSDKKLLAGELLVVDWGASVDGYGSDLTRTFAVGEADAECRRLHRIVLEANEAGRSAGRPGIACSEVDEAARSVIARAGYGKEFTHRTGHGIGRECHEEPYIRAGNPRLLETGMAYTVEPGIYLPGKVGIRIEDDLVVSEAGAECLSGMDRCLRSVG